MESKLKHLEFIQNVVVRMNSNSFLIKGWVITLISALFALAAKDADKQYILISYIIIPAFWVLDSYFLAQERKYRELYDIVRTNNSSHVDFSMDISNCNKPESSWSSCFLSCTLIIFYGITIGTTIFVMCSLH